MIQPTILTQLLVLQSAQALEKTDQPARKHRAKPWMRKRAYHRRIQKKWIRRFGYLYRPAILRTHNGIVVHPALWTQVMAYMES